MKYLVSVRLMTYMHASFIKKAMEGIMIQKTNFLVEVVIGDDFSTDNTLDIIKEFHNTEKIHIRILNRIIGDDYSKNRNKFGRLYNFIDILEKCTGKYIALLDGDDYWIDPLKLQKQVALLENNSKYSSSFHNTYMIGPYYNQKIEDKIIFNECLDQEVGIEDLLKNQKSIFHTSSFLFRTKCLVLPDWFTKVSSADMALFALVAGKGPIVRAEGVMSVYRNHDAGISKSKEHLVNKTKNQIFRLNLLDKYYNYQYTSIIKKTKQAFLNDMMPPAYRVLLSKYFGSIKRKLESYIINITQK